MQAFTELDNYKEEKRPSRSSNSTLATNFLNSVSSRFKTVYKKWGGNSISFQSFWWDVTLGLGDIDLVFILDYAYRIYTSLRILRRFWNQTALSIPDVDVRRNRYYENCQGCTMQVSLAYFLNFKILRIKIKFKKQSSIHDHNSY